MSETTETEIPTEETTEEAVPAGDLVGNPEPEEAAEPAEDAETFPREYVLKLRKEAADNRVKAKTAEELGARLHAALVTATGRLADPTDLPFDESHLADPEALTEAIAGLLERKPHLATRRPSGDIGQGILSEATDTVNLAGILRNNAR